MRILKKFLVLVTKGPEKKNISLELSGGSQIKKGENEFIHFDKQKNGKWRVIWTEKTIPEFKDIERIEVVRYE